MKFLPSNRFNLDHLPGLPRAQKIDEQPAEVRRILKRLNTMLDAHRTIAKRMDTTLETGDILAVLDALLAEAAGADPKPLLKCPDQIREYLRCTLYDEWVGEPSNILYTTQVSPETVRYEAMPSDFWTTCLYALRDQLAES
ncbi:MAG TPA: hypothetical protein PKE55_11895 [Kiritimatiellia bacterium]|nr:hypothetical protein [Kiritimatiellia bacterium]